MLSHAPITGQIIFILAKYTCWCWWVQYWSVSLKKYHQDQLIKKKLSHHYSVIDILDTSHQCRVLLWIKPLKFISNIVTVNTSGVLYACCLVPAGNALWFCFPWYHYCYKLATALLSKPASDKYIRLRCPSLFSPLPVRLSSRCQGTSPTETPASILHIQLTDGERRWAPAVYG